MYTIDNLDAVVELADLPQCSVGAPCPAIISGEQLLHLAYYLQEQEEWDGKRVRFENGQRSDQRCALVRFHGAYSHRFGPPNDEAFEAHPLYKRGLRPYAVAEVKNSSWIRALERMNSVHRDHKPASFAAMRHFIFPFHDSTFECVVHSFELSVERGLVSDVLRASCKDF
jgi:hypothetical protein